MLKTILGGLAALTLVISSSTAQAASSDRDTNLYRGMDTLAPSPSLPTVMGGDNALMLMGGADSGDITLTPADDETYTFNTGTWGSVGMYGRSSTSVQVSSNGILMFGSSNTAAFDNRPLPDSRFNTSTIVVAPFFDDLIPVAGTSTITYEAQVGSAVVIKWNDFALLSNPAARLSFQVALSVNDANGWALVQYVSMVGAGADGSGATIGVQRFDRDNKRWIQYSYNQTGAVTTGTAADGFALQTVLFDRDVDADGVPRLLEGLIGTIDTDFDTDTGGVGDGAEYFGGTDPLVLADDVNTNTDTDTLVDLDEAFFGTNNALDDTDGDGIDDDDEIFTTNTDPTLADTDGDGVSDFDEINGFVSTDPRDPRAFSGVDFSVNNNNKEKPVAVADAAGNIHVIIRDDNDSDFYYYQLSALGEVRVAETRFKLPVDIYSRRHSIHFYDGLLYVGYEIIKPVLGTDDAAELWLMVLNPALDDADGDAAAAGAITVSTTKIPVGGWPRHHDKEVGATGVHWVWTNYAGTPWPEDSGTTETNYYARTSLTGTLQEKRLLHVFDTGSMDAEDDVIGGTYGIHKIHSPRIDLDDAGVAHLVFMAQRAPYYQGGDENEWPSGLWYASVDGSAMAGPYRLGNGQGERTDISMSGSLAYIGISNGYDSDRDDYEFIGIRMAVFDTQAYDVIPRVGDFFGINWQVDPQSMVLPLQTVHANDTEFQGMTIEVKGNGVAIMQFSDDSDNLCVIAVDTLGQLLGSAPCYFAGRAEEEWRREPLILQDDNIVTIYNDGDNTDEVFYGRIREASFFDDSSVAAINQPPRITTQADGTGLGSGQAFSYAPAATDPEGGTLTWSLAAPPVGMTIAAASGLVDWTAIPGTARAVVTVCDDGTPTRCDTEALDFLVGNGSAPVVTSVPATQAVLDQVYGYQVVAVDPEDDIASYTLTSGPEGMSMDASGLVDWTAGALGSYAVLVTVTDDGGLTGLQSFTVTVTDSNGGGDGGGVTVDGSGGCSTGGGQSSGLLLLAMLGLFLVSRKRRA